MRPPAASIPLPASREQSPSLQKTRPESRPGKTKTSSSEVNLDLHRTGGRQMHSNSSVRLYRSPRNLDVAVARSTRVLRSAQGHRHRGESSRALKFFQCMFPKQSRQKAKWLWHAILKSFWCRWSAAASFGSLLIPRVNRSALLEKLPPSCFSLLQIPRSSFFNFLHHNDATNESVLRPLGSTTKLSLAFRCLLNWLSADFRLF